MYKRSGRYTNNTRGKFIKIAYPPNHESLACFCSFLNAIISRADVKGNFLSRPLFRLESSFWIKLCYTTTIIFCCHCFSRSVLCILFTLELGLCRNSKINKYFVRILLQKWSLKGTLVKTVFFKINWVFGI